MQLADVHSRAGSVIVAADAVVPNDTVRSSAASLSVALLDITGLNVAVAGQTGPVGAVVGDATGESECIYNPPHRQSVCLLFRNCVAMSVVLFVCLSFRPCICLSFRGCICLSLIPSLYLPIISSLYLSVYHSVVVLVCLSSHHCICLPYRRCTSLSIISSLY